MHKKGQLYLLSGILLSILVWVSVLDFVPEWELLGFFRGMLTGMSLVFVVNGLVLTFRSTRKKK